MQHALITSYIDLHNPLQYTFFISTNNFLTFASNIFLSYRPAKFPKNHWSGFGEQGFGPNSGQQKSFEHVHNLFT